MAPSISITMVIYPFCNVKRHMTATNFIEEAELQISSPQTDALVKAIHIPSRPATLGALQAEIKKEDPDSRTVARLVGSDVALTVAVLRVVNSAAMGLSRRCDTVENALAMIGFRQLGTIVTGLVLRNVLSSTTLEQAAVITRFWDVSSKRAYTMAHLAKGLGGVDVDLAQSFGLFCDVGIPLLIQKVPGYLGTLAQCEHAGTTQTFTEVEEIAHKVDHALIGAIMAKKWEMSPPLYLAIRLHHDFELLGDQSVPSEISRLIALNLLADTVIHRYLDQDPGVQWAQGGVRAMESLELNEEDVQGWVDRFRHTFSHDMA